MLALRGSPVLHQLPARLARIGLSTRPTSTLTNTNTSSSLSTNPIAATTTAATTPDVTFSSSPRLLPPNAEPAYLKNMSTGDIVALGVASIMTCHPLLVKLCAKVLPYMPNPLVKMVVYRLYCGGSNHEEVVQTAQKLQQRGFGVMISYSVERADG